MYRFLSRAALGFLCVFSTTVYTQEGEGEVCPAGPHSADTDGNGAIELSELLRVIQFYNSGGFHCALETTEDGYASGPGAHTACCPHDSDYHPERTPNWRIDLLELMRLIQFYNFGAYHRCEPEGTEDGFCPGEAVQPPNVVMMIFCTLRLDRIGAVRGDLSVMPYLDQFATESAHFTRAISAASWTRPGVLSLHTGMYPETFHGNDETPAPERFVLTEETVSIVEWLAGAGYDAWAYQTNGNAGGNFGFDRGYPEGQYAFNSFAPADEVTGAVLETMPQWRPPFFQLVQYIEAHAPYVPPLTYNTVFGPTPATTVGDNLKLSDLYFMDFVFDLFESWRDSRPPSYTPLTANGVEMVRYRYDASVRAQDDEVARLIEAIIDAHPNTIFVLVADHGEDLLERNILGHGHTLYQEQINVPLVVGGPGVPVGEQTHLVQTLDVLPTLARLTGLPPLAAWHGRDLFDTTPRPVFSTTRTGFGPILISADAVIDGDMKYIHSNKMPGPELYNLHTDPEERDNLAEAQPAEVARLEALLQAHRAEVMP